MALMAARAGTRFGRARQPTVPAIACQHAPTFPLNRFLPRSIAPISVNAPPGQIPRFIALRVEGVLARN
jgi:hypothetical protein